MKSLILSLAVILAALPALAQPDGQTVYAGYCQACHQASGAGIKGAFPALAGDPFVTGAPSPVIDRVLKGKGGMPPFKGQVDDARIAAAITYIRTSFGNHASPITPAQIEAVEKGP